MGVIDEYYLNSYKEDMKENDKALDFYSDFVRRFPKESIQQMTMEDYLFSPKGFGYDNTFCRRLMYSPIASMGNNFPAIFGIYLKEGKVRTLSASFKPFGNDFDGAFDRVKNDIVGVLDAAERGDYVSIEKSKLNSAFKQILIATYFPEMYMPAPTSKTLNAYCHALGFDFSKKISLAEKNHHLVEWMKSAPICEGWNSFLLMRFCDWLWRSNQSIDGEVFSSSQIKEVGRHGTTHTSENHQQQAEEPGPCLDEDGFSEDIFPESSIPTNSFEGAVKQVLVNKYERSSVARQKCIEHFGCKCYICGLDFKKKYGDIGDGFIHVHHIVPLDQIGKEYVVDYEKDLIPVCPNCHAMLHRTIDGREVTIDELKQMIKS